MTLTILCIEKHLIELGLIVIKGPSDFVYHLLISQVTIHEAAKRKVEALGVFFS